MYFATILPFSLLSTFNLIPFPENLKFNDYAIYYNSGHIDMSLTSSQKIHCRFLFPQP